MWEEGLNREGKGWKEEEGRGEGRNGIEEEGYISD